jgi:hypothetical protein
VRHFGTTIRECLLLFSITRGNYSQNSLKRKLDHTTMMQKKTDNNSSTTPSTSSEKKASNRPSSVKQFPGKLHDLLTHAERNGLDYIISWVHDGKAFMVHNQYQLLEILPIFFGQTKFRSFQRQLNVS